jgi:hypothetical protein
MSINYINKSFKGFDMPIKKAIVTEITRQDGAYIAEFLLNLGYYL